MLQLSQQGDLSQRGKRKAITSLMMRQAAFERNDVTRHLVARAIDDPCKMNTVPDEK